VTFFKWVSLIYIAIVIFTFICMLVALTWASIADGNRFLKSFGLALKYSALEAPKGPLTLWRLLGGITIISGDK